MTRLPTALGLALASTIALAPAAAAATAPAPQVISAYALAAPTTEAASGLVARAVIPAGASCPDLRVTDADGRTRNVAMSVRPTPAGTSPAFDAITVCSVPIPTTAVRASIAGARIPARMPARIDRMALLGDSGCRVVSWQVQACGSVDAWPFARVAASIADERPDVIAFNGDWFYREGACPDSAQALCGSSPPPVGGLPFTDSAYGWIADALLPMAPMMSAAPLVVTRGNHEACNRGGNGYFLLFDPREGTSGTCAPVLANGVLTAAPTVPTPTYAIDLAVRPGRTLRLAVVDSAGGSDTSITPFAAVQRPSYEAAAALTRPRAGRESWLYTHRPSYAYVTDTFAAPGKPFSPWTAFDQTAASVGLLGTYDLVFSSHLHLAQAVQLPGLPPQLVLGNAGTLLDPTLGYPLPATGPALPDGTSLPAPSWAWVDVRFGYALATPGTEPGQWRLSMRDPDGTQVARCGLADRRLYCR